VVVLAEKVRKMFIGRRITSKKHLHTMEVIKQWAIGVLLLSNKVIPFFIIWASELHSFFFTSAAQISGTGSRHLKLFGSSSGSNI